MTYDITATAEKPEMGRWISKVIENIDRLVTWPIFIVHFVRLSFVADYLTNRIVMLLPVLAIAYASAVLYNILIFDGMSLKILYTWHPICANMFVVFAALGMSAAQGIRGQVARTRSAKEPYVNRHALFNWLALFSLAGAAVTIYLNKERNSRPHFTTYHGITGAVTGVAFLANVLGGGTMRTLPGLYKYISFHRLNGYLIFSALLAAHATAVLRGYAGFRSNPYGQYGLLGMLAAVLLAVVSSVKLGLLPGGKAKKQ